MTTCDACGVKCVRMVADKTGLVRLLCEDCMPPVLANGTQPGNRPVTDFADHVGINAARDIEIATARAEAAVEVLRILVRSFERELAGGYATHEQQTALRRARALIAEAEGG